LIECVDSSKTTVDQKASDATQGNGRSKDDERTPCSKLAGKRSAELAGSEMTVYDLDGDESATKTVSLKCVKVEPKE
jgi:hypothetical protein